MRTYSIGSTVVRRGNVGKLGKKVSTVHASGHTCSDLCALKAICYREAGNIRFTSTPLDSALNQDLDGIARDISIKIRRLRGGRHLRLFAGGDAKTPAMAQTIAAATRYFMKRTGMKAWGYTHSHLEGVTRNDWKGVSVLASCETPGKAKQLMSEGWAVAIVLPFKKHPSKKKYDFHGLSVIPCPNQTHDNISCEDCLLCTRAEMLLENKTAIGFATHGIHATTIIDIVHRMMAAEGITV